jgi:soluble lytic murein transglycosylase
LRAKADALFRARTRYIDASAAYTQASQQGGAHAAEDAFMAARSLARADKDEQAIVDFEAVERRFPRTTWADQAAFHAARLQLLLGRWRDAATAFDAYRKKYPNGVERKDAHRNAALAHLMAGDYKLARRLFGQIADDEGDGLAGARAATMEALAAAKEGDKTHAIARWTEVARSKPLTWPALVARARLLALSAPLPPAIDPPDTAPAPEPLKLTLPPPVDLLHRIGLDGDAEDALREREGVVTQGALGRTTEALCIVYGMIGRAQRRYQLALQIPNAMFGAAPGPKTRWAWECAYPSPFEAIVHAREQIDGIPPGLVWAVMRQESNFAEDAVSPARAVGLMQLLPETARAVAEAAQIPHDDALLTSPPQNLGLGARYLHELLERFKGNVPLALGGYNGGPDAIARWSGRTPAMEVDVFVEHIPFTETRIYVARVMGNLARYGYLREGEAGVPKVPLALP